MIEILLLLLISGLRDTSGQFLNQPAAETQFVPLRNRVVLTCSAEQGYVVDWRITLVGDVDESREAANTIDLRDILTPRNFTFAGVGSSNSTASFGLLNAEGEQVNNATKISCVAQQGFDRVSGNRVEVIFYGSPPPPADLSVTEDELGSLNISWSLGFIEGVPVNYTLTVLYLNTTRAQPIIIAGLLDQHYMFETNGPCDVYSFTVTAVTAAGNSAPSQELIFTREGNSEMCLSLTTQSSPSSTNSGAVAGGVITVIVVIILIITILVVLLLSCPIMTPKDINLTSTSHSITAEWNSLPRIRRCAVFFSIKLKLMDENEEREQITTVISNLTFDNLEPGTKYTVNVAEANKIIRGRSTAKNITTKHTAPSIPEGLTLSATSDSIIATWDLLPKNNQHGTITHYVVKIAEKGASTPEKENDASTNKFTFNLLRPGTAYQVYVAAANDIGRGPFASEALSTELPQYHPEDYEVLRENFSPLPTPKRTNELKEFAQFSREVKFILQTVREEEFFAAVTFMKPPTCGEYARAVTYPGPGLVVGMFSGHMAALIKTDVGANAGKYLQKAINSFPNTKIIIGIGSSYAFDKQYKLGDVLVSNKICNFANFKIDKNGKFINRGEIALVRRDLRQIFCNDLDFEDYAVAKPSGRIARAHFGTFGSCPFYIDNQELRDKVKAAIPEVIGGEMEGGELLRISYENPKIGVIIIKGVSNYADGSSYQEWKFTASMAALAYAESKMKYLDKEDII